MFDFINSNQTNFSIIGLTILIFTLLGLLLFCFLAFINYYTKVFIQKKDSYEFLMKFVNGYLAGFILAVVLAFVLCHIGHSSQKLNRLISLTVVFCILLKLNYIRYKVYLNSSEK